MNITKLKTIAAAALCAVGLSSFAAEPEAVQLWEGGPYWATVNVGTAEEGQSAEYGALYKFDDAAKAVTDALGEGWRLPTLDDFNKLRDTSYCTQTWDSTKKGYIFTGATDGYTDKSIFMPAAGIGNGGLDREDAGKQGNYWSSGVYNDGTVWRLYFDVDKVRTYNFARSNGLSVRAVRNTPPAAEPSVTVGKVESGEPWSKITVNYTLGGTDAKTDYKVAFDITAGGETASVTNDAAKLTDGAATKEIDTATIFGKQVADTQAKVKVSLIAIKPKAAGVQLWANGPFWAEANLGESEDSNHPEYGALYTFDKADEAVKSLLGEEWRVPTKDDFEKLVDASYCTKTWDSTKKGYTFTGKGDYESNSIFLPAAGLFYGNRRQLAMGQGYCWSSEANGGNNAWLLIFDEDSALVGSDARGYALSVRAVRDAK